MKDFLLEILSEQNLIRRRIKLSFFRKIATVEDDLKKKPELEKFLRHDNKPMKITGKIKVRKSTIQETMNGTRNHSWKNFTSIKIQH